MTSNNQLHIDQRRLSEQLLLLQELQHNTGNPHIPDVPSPDKQELRLLDTIAAVLTTGRPGDIFAAALDKRQHIELVLAKNGLPTSEDISAANELIALIMNPDTTNVLDLFPFLFRRCGPNINKRIRNLHVAILDEKIRNDFVFLQGKYKPDADITIEFPGVIKVLTDYGDEHPVFSGFWDYLVQTTTDKTSQELDTSDIPSSTQKFAEIFRLTHALWSSRFLKSLIEDHLDRDRKDRIDRLKRRLDKIRQYVIDVSDLIHRVKRSRLPRVPLPHRWVTDISGMGEGVFTLGESVPDVVSFALEQPSLSPEDAERLNERFPSLVSNWAQNRTVHTCLHAEVRIILHLSSFSNQDPDIRPIGVSKQSCLCCVLWLEAYNRIFETRWVTTSKCRRKLSANWALPGDACGYPMDADGRRKVDNAVLRGVSMHLTDALDWLRRRWRVDDDVSFLLEDLASYL